MNLLCFAEAPSAVEGEGEGTAGASRSRNLRIHETGKCSFLISADQRAGFRDTPFLKFGLNLELLMRAQIHYCLKR